jgi:hypothetical protein
MCLFKSDLVVHSNGQKGHAKAFSPGCARTWASKVRLPCRWHMDTVHKQKASRPCGSAHGYLELTFAPLQMGTMNTQKVLFSYIKIVVDKVMSHNKMETKKSSSMASHVCAKEQRLRDTIQARQSTRIRPLVRVRPHMITVGTQTYRQPLHVLISPSETTDFLQEEWR